jgi:uncharacterized protein (DUF302 family)
MDMNEFFFESKSRFDFEETVSKLSEIIVSGGWKVVYTHDLEETMRKNGFEVLPVKVIELCKPDYAYRILSDDEQRIYSNMMPCRISIYRKADGFTYISRLNTAMLASQIGGVVEEVMTNSFGDAETFVNAISE